MDERRSKIIEKREYFVVKGNELIQKNRYDLSLIDQKTVSYICSMIKPLNDLNSELKLDYEFNIKDYCEVCGIDYNSGKNYKDVKETIKRLADRSMWLDTGDSEILMRWLSFIKINKKSGKINIEIDKNVAKYLFKLKDKYTQYQLYNILAMQSAFSVRLYEIMRSYLFKKTKTFEVEELKRLLNVDKVKSYKNFSLFKTKVIEKAILEIDTLTDIFVSYEPIYNGKKIVKLKFRIEPKRILQRLKIDHNLILDGK